MRNTTLLVAALVAFSPAQAQTSSDSTGSVRTRAVSFADLDLTRPAGIARLRQRIAQAVERVCGSYADFPSWEIPRLDQCRRDAFAQAEVQLARVRDRSVDLAENAQHTRR